MAKIQFRIDEQRDRCWLIIDDAIIFQKVTKEEILEELKSGGVIAGI